MPEDQNPRGRFGLPRFTDIGPQVSHHNTPPSECDIERCFDGHSKEEIMWSVLDAYKVFQREVETSHSLRIPAAEGVFLSGSVVRGNFGCRSVEKAREIGGEELVFEARDVDISEEMVKNELDRAESEADDAPEFFDILSESLSDDLGERIIREVRDLTGCSDIDMFAFVDLPVDEARRLDRDNFHPLLVEAVEPAERELITDSMGIDPGVKSARSVTDTVVTSPEEFKRLIERYY